MAFLSTRPAGPVPQIPTNIVKQTSRTCVTPPQTKRRPSPANATDLRLGGGCRHLLHGYAHTCTYGHAHTFMGTLTAMVTRARSLTCTAMVIHSRACARPRQHPDTLLTRPASGSHKSSANPVHSNALRLRNTSADQAPTNQLKTPGGHGRQRRRQRCDAATPRRQGPSTCVIVRPEGRTDSRAIGPKGPITVKPNGLTGLKARQRAVRSDGKPA